MRAMGLRDLLAWLLRRRHRVRVTGPSMAPTIPAGTTVLVKPTQTVRPGDIVVTKHPRSTQITIVKRVDHLTDTGDLFLRGDGTPSTDSRDFGPVPSTLLLGKVVCTLP